MCLLWCWLCAVRWISRCVSRFKPSWSRLWMPTSRKASKPWKRWSWTRSMWRNWSLLIMLPVFWWRRSSRTSRSWARVTARSWRHWLPLSRRWARTKSMRLRKPEHLRWLSKDKRRWSNVQTSKSSPKTYRAGWLRTKAAWRWRWISPWRKISARKGWRVSW